MTREIEFVWEEELQVSMSGECELFFPKTGYFVFPCYGLSVSAYITRFFKKPAYKKPSTRAQKIQETFRTKSISQRNS